MSLVSIIIPVYNNEKYVEKCVRSVMNQSYHKLEIIIINDGSNDKSSEILQRLANEDERIHLITQENSGVAIARNRGLDAASGEYVTFVDGDDYIGTEYIMNLYVCAKKQNSDMVICGIKFTKPDGKILHTIIPGEYQRFQKEEWTFRISAVCSHFYKRELWEKYKIRFFSGERGEDMPISLFFSAICDKISILQEAEYYYVQHASSAMHNFKGLNTYQLPLKALEDTLKKVQNAGLVNSPEFYELFVLRILCTCFFNLGRGASREKMKDLCDFIVRILNMYFPKYYKNPFARIFTKIDVPFAQRAGVKILVLLVRSRLLYPVSLVLSK